MHGCTPRTPFALPSQGVTVALLPARSRQLLTLLARYLAISSFPLGVFGVRLLCPARTVFKLVSSPLAKPPTLTPILSKTLVAACFAGVLLAVQYKAGIFKEKSTGYPKLSRFSLSQYQASSAAVSDARSVSHVCPQGWDG